MGARTLYIVDDNAQFLEATCFWLQGMELSVQAWTDPKVALTELTQRDCTQPACLMLDIRMPELSGLDVHDELLSTGSVLPIIYMSGHADVPLAVQAMEKGAITLLEKPFDEFALESALDRAFSTPMPTHSTPEPVAVAQPNPEDSQAHQRFIAREASLSPRERQVLSHVIEGTYNKVIADKIGLSIKTIELYRARGMAKMKAGSAAELTRMMVSEKA